MTARLTEDPLDRDAAAAGGPGGAATDGVLGVVLAGSYYWGQTSFEQLLRGPMLPVAQLPIVCYPLLWLRDAGVEAVTVCANSSTPTVRRTLGDGSALGLALDYYDDDHPRGPAGCVRDAVVARPAREIVVVEGAIIPSLDLGALLAAHREAGAAVTTVVEVDRRRNAVGWRRPPAPGGIYVFSPEALAAVPAHGYFDIKQGLLERLYASGAPVHTHEVQGIAPRVLDAASYLSVSGWIVSTAAERAAFRDFLPYGEGLRHPTAHVDPSVQVIGPVLIGPRARVEAGAVLVGPVSIGADSVVGAGALVARASIWERCRVGDGAMVDTSLLAHGVAVGAGEHLRDTVHVIDAAGRPADGLAAPAVLPAAGGEHGVVARVPDAFSFLGCLPHAGGAPSPLAGELA